MNRIAIVILSTLLLACTDQPWILTAGLPDPDPGKPHEVHLCIKNTADPDQFLENLCAKYPYAWEEDCEANDKLQTCEEFVLAFLTTCPMQDTCDYEKCSLAMQMAPCGEWPETCTQVVNCQDPIWPPPEEVPPTTTMEPTPTSG